MNDAAELDEALAALAATRAAFAALTAEAAPVAAAAAAVVTAATAAMADAAFLTVEGEVVIFGAIVEVDSATKTVEVVSCAGVVTGGTVVSGAGSSDVVVWPGIVVGGSVVGVVVLGTVDVVVPGIVVVVIGVVVVVVVGVMHDDVLKVKVPLTVSLFSPYLSDLTPSTRIRTVPRGTRILLPPLMDTQANPGVVVLQVTVAPVSSERTLIVKATQPLESTGSCLTMTSLI